MHGCVRPWGFIVELLSLVCINEVLTAITKQSSQRSGVVVCYCAAHHESIMYRPMQTNCNGTTNSCRLRLARLSQQAAASHTRVILLITSRRRCPRHRARCSAPPSMPPSTVSTRTSVRCRQAPLWLCQWRYRASRHRTVCRAAGPSWVWPQPSFDPSPPTSLSSQPCAKASRCSWSPFERPFPVPTLCCE